VTLLYLPTLQYFGGFHRYVPVQRRWPNQVIQRLDPMYQSVDKAQLLYYWR
jgi:hypothetical protein